MTLTTPYIPQISIMKKKYYMDKSIMMIIMNFKYEDYMIIGSENMEEKKRKHYYGDVHDYQNGKKDG